ncbi:Acyl-CoA dehydrogenase [Micromonospora phaseoli]|uniref:Acyl-CoA dehydrogenase n=1 Tax=Micromonospora phaseoli TaxID=1144548 RepID=A0A1H6UK04_9ACTN|nr:acyl-CoA dehydrogenase family protein [Micromonospora phaseoli]PZV99048.1 alkylation response protein AidB-like acyl-CoA dehydrogenase [Micromonospora phaseoli]GIJ76198.1 acyl-CoA dehydrogenase [Micromonospora phaseoli]SEI92653.1 Acyl-CoA dehydrogenase [Micromonospora phaseoli]
MSDLLYDSDEEALRDTVRALLAAHAPWQRTLARLDDGEPYDAALWTRLVDQLGVTGLAVPVEYGGAGAGFREVAVVLEELGRAVAPVPFLGVVVATRALLACGERELLGQLATGERDVALAVCLATAPDAAPRPVTVAPGPVLTGTVTGVADALAGDVLLVPAGDGLYAVNAADRGVRLTPVVSLDATRPLADVAFTGAPARLVAAGPMAARAVSAALTAGAALLASEQVGLAQWCLDATVAHVRDRRQFGRPIGSFQAVKHRLADLWVEITEARAVARHAADRLAAGHPEASLAAALAQAYCAPVAVRAAEVCVQLHGGLGFTWEHPAHLYLKRAKSAAVAFGTTDRHRAALARLVDLPAPAEVPDRAD